MKLIITNLFVLLLISTASIFAQNANLVVFSEDSDRFFLIINGVHQNKEAQANVKLTQMVSAAYKVKVVFENPNFTPLEKTVYPEAGQEYSFNIKRNKKGEIKLGLFSVVDINNNILPGQYVMIYGTTGTQTVSNNTTTSNNTATYNNNTTAPVNQNNNSNQNYNNTSNPGYQSTTTVQSNTNTVQTNSSQNNNVNTNTNVNANTNGVNMNMGVGAGQNGMNLNLNISENGMNMNLNESNPNQNTGNVSMNTNVTANPYQNNNANVNVNSNVNNPNNNTNYTQSTTTTTTTTTRTVNGQVVENNSNTTQYNNNNANANVNMNVNGNTTSTNFNNSNSTNYNNTNTSNNNNQNNVRNNTNSNVCFPMNDADFSKARSSVEGKNFDDSRLSIAKQAVTSNCMTSGQIKQILDIFSFEESKINFAKFAYSRCSDPQNYFLVNDAFNFDSSVEELNKAIGK